MKHVSQTAFARTKRAAPEVLEHGPDKWVLLGRLTTAADHYALSHRTLSVLKALLTFLPTRHIPSGPAAIVFPSNRTLSHRLSGMPESTLRRHLGLLVEAGIVSRQDSPNRKRFARHRAGTVAIAYGFDLSPLAQIETDLETHAAEAQRHQEALAILRCQVHDLRALVIARNGDCALTDDAARLLRRKPVERHLNDMLAQLEMAADAPASAGKMSSCDSENERHIQTESKYYSGISQGRRNQNEKHMITLSEALDHSRSVQDFFTEKIRNWQDLESVSQRLAPMIGVDPDTLNKARKAIGARATSISVLCILERFHSIENPAGYLMSLVQQAQNGSFNLKRLLKGNIGGNCQLTTFYAV